MTSFSFLEDCLHGLKILPDADRQAEQCGVTYRSRSGGLPSLPFLLPGSSGALSLHLYSSRDTVRFPMQGNIPILFFVMFVTVFFF